jgi:hypothetical protein
MCGTGHRKFPDDGEEGDGLLPDFVGRNERLQTKNPLDFILQMNEWQALPSLHVHPGADGFYTAPHLVGDGGPHDGHARNPND